MKQRSGMAIGLVLAALLSASAVVPSRAVAATPDAGGGDAADSGIGIGIRMLDIPAASQTDPRARAYIIDNVPPGTTIQRRVRVRNGTDTAQSIAVYPAAARISGGAFIGDEGATANELTSWISVAQPELSVAAHATADDLVTIAVPATATMGERYAAVWAEIRSARPSAGADAHHPSITSISRVGVRTYLSVGPGNGPQSSFAISSLTAQRDANGTPHVLAAVENTGGRAIDLSGTLSLSGGPAGLNAGPFPTERIVTLAPGAKGNVTVPLSASLPRGPWDAKLTLSSGLLSQSIAATVTLPAAGHRATTVAPAGLSGRELAWIIGGGIAVLIILIAAGILVAWAIRSRRRRSRR
ncbi:MAG TPA: hypothetical protein VGC45_10945 [Gryllotalpicola sp.]